MSQESVSFSEVEPASELLVVDRVEQSLRSWLASNRHKAGTKLAQERELAEQYGVSRQSIRAAIARLKEDRLVRALPGKGTFITPQTKQSTGVMVFSSAQLHSYNMMCVGVLSEVTRKRGLAPMLVNTVNPADEWESVIADHPHAAGAIVVGTYPRSVVRAMTERCDRPLVMVSDMDESFRGAPVCDSVTNDNAALHYAATEHLIHQGYRRIALVGWDFSRVWTREALRGYRDALRAAGIEPQEDWSVDLPSQALSVSDPAEFERRRADIRRRVAQWFESSDEPMGLIHSAGDETRMRDVLDDFFLGAFTNEQIVVATFRETLITSYTGLSDATAMCVRFRDIAERAMDLLQRKRSPHEAPTRETQGGVYLCRRKQGVWQDARS